MLLLSGYSVSCYNCKLLFFKLTSNDYTLPLVAVRPEVQNMLREVGPDKIPPAPPLPYDSHSLPHFMDNNNPEKYFKLGNHRRVLLYILIKCPLRIATRNNKLRNMRVNMNMFTHINFSKLYKIP